jgi:putative copper resistance protein D
VYIAPALTAYVVSVYLHVLAAATWVGGIVFLVVVVVPALHRADRAAAAPILRATVVRFRAVGWTAFAVLIATGVYNLHARAIGWAELSDPAFRATPLGRALIAKLALFGVVLVLGGVHDFWIGPRALVALERAPDAPEVQRLRKLTGWIGRINGLCTLVIVFLAICLVRGCP